MKYFLATVIKLNIDEHSLHKKLSEFDNLGHSTLSWEDNTGKGISKENSLPTGKRQTYVKPTHTG